MTLYRLFFLLTGNLRTIESTRSPKFRAAPKAKPQSYFTACQPFLAQRRNTARVTFRQLAPARLRTKASIRKRLEAALSKSAYPFSDSSQADAKTSRYRSNQGCAYIRRVISSRPLAVSLAFLWLFTLSSPRLAVVYQLQLYRFEAE